jgi:hypothetical protein
MPPKNYKPVHGQALFQNIYDQKKNNKRTPKKENSLKQRFLQNMNNLIEHHKNFTDSTGKGIYL